MKELGGPPVVAAVALAAHGGAGDRLRAATLVLRLSLARRLLRDTSEPVMVIAGRCGFTNLPHFSRLFARHVGASPSRYRTAAMAQGMEG